MDSESQTENDNDNTDLANTMYSLIPGVWNFLTQQGTLHTQRLIEYLQLLASGSFPMTNICYSIFLDLIQWHTVSNPTEMRYTPEVKRFWYLGKILFHTKFLEFMRGNSSKGDTTVDTQTRKKVNFPVPTDPQNDSSQTPEKIFHGFISELLQVYANSNETSEKSFNISLDLKKINADKVDSLGTIDLSGHEASPTKSDIENRLKTELSDISAAASIIQDQYSKLNNRKASSMPVNAKQLLITRVKDLILLQSNRIKDLRKYLAGKEYALYKLLQRASDEQEKNWQKTRFAFAISFMKTNVIQTKDCLSRLLKSNDRLGELCASLQESRDSYVSDRGLNLSHQPNYICMTGLEEIDIKNLGVGSDEVSPVLQQRSDAWKTLRMTAKAIGK